MAKYARIFILLLFIIGSGCEKDDSELYEEVLRVETRSVNETENHRFFIFVENSNSTPVYKEIPNYSEYTFIRNGQIKGDVVNIHVISVNSFGLSPSYSIRSYTSVPVGKRVVFGRDNILNDKSATARVNLEFENIPDFDVVSRSVHMQSHSHTITSFHDVPCEPTGQSTFPTNETFYSCFQKGNDASYFLQKVETNESPYSISFNNLKSQMTHYALPKKMGGSEMSQVSIMAYDVQINAIELFNLSDITIFPNENIDFFIPETDLNISHFLIEYSTFIGSLWYRHVFSSETIITTPELINAELNTASEVNSSLEISATGDVDFISIRNNFEGSSWTIYGNGSADLYFPELPVELTDYSGNPDFIKNSESIIITVFDYSELNGYDDALEILLDDSKELMDNPGLNYKSLSKTVSYQH